MMDHVYVMYTYACDLSSETVLREGDKLQLSSRLQDKSADTVTTINYPRPPVMGRGIG